MSLDLAIETMFQLNFL